MKSYEGVFIFPPEVTPDVRKAQLKLWEDTIQKFEGQVLQKTEWGKRSLGYPVHKFNEGYILVADFQMNPARATEFRKALQLQEDLLKYMVTVKVEKKVAPPKTASQPAAASHAAHAPHTTHPTHTTHTTHTTPKPSRPASASSAPASTTTAS